MHMAINKIIYAGNSLIDLTGDSITPETLLAGKTAHDASGAVITGVATPDIIVDENGDGQLRYIGLSVNSSGDGTVI